MCNGIDTYDQAVTAIELHNDAYTNKDRTFVCGDDEKTFKECCNGMSGENLKARHIVFEEIITKIVGSNVNNYSSLNVEFQNA